MPSWAIPIWSLIGGFWFPLMLVLAGIIFVVMLGGDLLHVVAKGASHLGQLATNTGSRLLGVLGIALLGLIVVSAFHFIPGAPNVTSYFPAVSTTAPAAPTAPNPPAGPTTGQAQTGG